MAISTILYTYKDLIDHLVNYSGGVGHAATLPRIKFAVQQAYRNLVNYHEWKYLYRNLVILTNAPYDTGTVAYDHTGGTYERQLTLTTGTWPTWAEQGHVRIDGEFYEVESRKSSSVVTLRENSNPGQDVASGETYTLYQSRYTLPADFRKTYSGVLQSQAGPLRYVPPDQWHFDERYFHSQGTVQTWTVMGSPNDPGRMSLYFAPYPGTATTIAFLYQRLSRPMKYDGTGSAESTGTISWSASGTAITGSGTSFTSAQIGSVIRAGSASVAPDGIEGANPYSEQGIILSVASGTSATLQSASTAAVSGVKFTISDPVDIPQHMLDALFRGCELQLGVGGRNSPATSTLASIYEDALRRALANDNMSLQSMASGSVGLNHEVYMSPATSAIETSSGNLEV